METVKSALLSEIQELQESLWMIARRVKEGKEIGSHTNVNAGYINNLIGKYQLLMEVETAKSELRQPDISL